MKTLPILFCAGLILAGCVAAAQNPRPNPPANVPAAVAGQPQSYEIHVKSESSNLAPERPRFVILPSAGPGLQKDYRFKDIAALVETELGKKGYMPIRQGEPTNLAVFLSYDADLTETLAPGLRSSDIENMMSYLRISAFKVSREKGTPEVGDAVWTVSSMYLSKDAPDLSKMFPFFVSAAKEYIGLTSGEFFTVEIDAADPSHILNIKITE